MNTTVEAGWVTMLDDKGEVSRSMSLEQYEKHARDSTFVAALKPADRSAIDQAITAAKPAAPK